MRLEGEFPFFRPVLGTAEEPNFIVKRLTESLKEVLIVAHGRAVVVGQVLPVVGEGQEAVVLVHLFFMHCTDRPGARSIDAAPLTLIAGECELMKVDGLRVLRAEGDLALTRIADLAAPVSADRMEAGHD